MKSIIFAGSSLSDLRAFPAEARREAGHQLDRVQRGLEPDDWKPIKTIGPGGREIRIKEASGAFRVIYVTAGAEAVHVIHAFNKKTQKTSRHDLDIARERLKELRRR